MSTPPALDKQGALERLGGDEALWRDVVAVFLEDIPNQVSELAAHVDRHDLESSKRRSHAIKSAAGNIGAAAMSTTAALIERRSAERRLEDVVRLTERLQSEFKELVTLLKDESTEFHLGDRQGNP